MVVRALELQYSKLSPPTSREVLFGSSDYLGATSSRTVGYV